MCIGDLRHTHITDELPLCRVVCVCVGAERVGEHFPGLYCYLRDAINCVG